MLYSLETLLSQHSLLILQGPGVSRLGLKWHDITEVNQQGLYGYSTLIGKPWVAKYTALGSRASWSNSMAQAPSKGFADFRYFLMYSLMYALW